MRSPRAKPIAAPDFATLADRCPRCGGGFHCGRADASPCACTGLTLSAELHSALRQRYSGCLCLPCLAALAAGAPLAPSGPPLPV